MHGRMIRPRVNRAFTLIELLVVVAIIALLISILLPSLSRARMLAKRSVTLAHLRGLGLSMQSYQHENREEHPALFDHEEKAFLGVSLLAKLHTLPVEFLINPHTDDAAATELTPDGRPVLADLNGVEVTNDTEITPANLGQVRWRLSFSYDNDNKRTQTRTRTSFNTFQPFVYAGDRADYARGRTFSANWDGEGMCLIWSDQHAEFRRKRSLPDQSDPNIYHHNEFMGEGGDEVVDGVEVTEYTLDTHLRFFSEEEDDELLPE